MSDIFVKWKCFLVFFCSELILFMLTARVRGNYKDTERIMIDTCMAFSLSGTLLCNSNVRWKGKNTEEGMFLEGRQPSR